MKIFCLVLIVFAVNSYVNPVQNVRDSPDPGVIHVGSYYYATTTGGWDGHKFPIWRSNNLVNWTQQSFGLMTAPSWTSNTDFWAPQIHLVNNSFNLYYTARNKAGKLCIGVAYSTNPLGPYIDIQSALWEQSDLGIIDATFFRTNNINYLIYKTDGNAVGKPTEIYAIQLSQNGRKVIGNRVFLLRDTLAYQKGIVQAPWVIYQNNFYYIFYSSCGYADQCYSVSVARSNNFLGPYVKYNQTILHTRSPQTNKSMQGPGHCSVLKGPNGNYAIVYHAWPHNQIGTKRLMLLDKISWTADHWPYVGYPSQQQTPIP